LPGAGSGGAEEVADLGPGVLLVAGVGHGLGDALLDFVGEADEEVKCDAAITVPVESGEGAKGSDGFVDHDSGAVVGGGGNVVIAARSPHHMCMDDYTVVWGGQVQLRGSGGADQLVPVAGS
jgi:hypothetical protein